MYIFCTSSFSIKSTISCGVWPSMQADSEGMLACLYHFATPYKFNEMFL